MSPDVAIEREGRLRVVSGVQQDLDRHTVENKVDCHDPSLITHPRGDLLVAGAEHYKSAALWANVLICDFGRVENFDPNLRFALLER